MGVLSFFATIDRTSLGLGDLVLPQAGVYELVSVGEGSLQWQHETQNSQFVHGDLRVATVEQNRTGVVQVRVKGASSAAMWTNISTLITAMTQKIFTITFGIGGSNLDFWDVAGPAEYSMLKGGYDKLELISTQSTYEFSTVYSPVSTGV